MTDEQTASALFDALAEANARIAELEGDLKDCRTMLLATGASLAEARATLKEIDNAG